MWLVPFTEIHWMSLFATVVIFLCGYIAYRITVRPPLYHHLFIVETSTWENRRLVQVLYIGQNIRNRISWSRLISLLRQRAQIYAGPRSLIQNVDTSFIEQAPSTTVEVSGENSLPDPNSYSVWDIDLSPNRSQETGRDSQYAAAAVIAVLARGFRSGVHRRNLLYTEADFSNPVRGGVNGINSITVNVVNDPNPRIAVPESEEERRAVEEEIRNQRMDAGSEEQQQEEVEIEVFGDRQEESVEEDAQVPGPSTSFAGAAHEECPKREDDVAAEDLETFPLRLKFLDDTEMSVNGVVGETIGNFKRKHFPDHLNGGKIVRLIYQGQLLRDDSRSLDSYGVTEGSVIHCHVSNTPYSKSNQTHSSSRPVDQDEIRRRRPTEGAAHAAPHVPEDDPTEDREPQQQETSVSVYLMMAAIFQTFFPDFGRAIAAGWRDVMPQPTVLGRPNVFWRAYRWLHNTALNANRPSTDDGPQNLEESAEAAARPRQTMIRIGDYLLWIFAGQFLAVWVFVCWFPEVCDRTALSLLILLTLYFVFVVCRDNLTVSPPQRRQPPLNVL